MSSCSNPGAKDNPKPVALICTDMARDRVHLCVRRPASRARCRGAVAFLGLAGSVGRQDRLRQETVGAVGALQGFRNARLLQAHSQCQAARN